MEPGLSPAGEAVRSGYAVRLLPRGLSPVPLGLCGTERDRRPRSRSRGPGPTRVHSAPCRPGGPPSQHRPQPHGESWPIPRQTFVLSTNPALPNSPLLANPGLAGGI